MITTASRTRNATRAAVACWALVVVAATSAVAAQEDDHPSVGRYELVLPRRSDDEIAQRARALASLMRGQSLEDEAFSKIYARDGMRFGEANGGTLFLRYDERFDYASVVDVDVANDFQSATDIGEVAAREIFQAMAERVLSERLIDTTGIDLSKVTLQHEKQGIGIRGEVPREWIKEYIFFVRRELDGAGIRGDVREAGLQVSVHRRGAISSVRVLGPTVAQRVGVSGQVAVGRQEAIDTVVRAFPASRVEPLGLNYVLSDDGRFALGWDHRVGSVAAINGQTINGRLQYVTSSVDDPGTPLLAWPIVEPIRPASE